MGRVLIALIATFFGSAVADTEHVVFTTRTTWGSPVVVSDPVTSKEFGFESVTLHNYSKQAIAALDLKVVLVTAESLEQEVDGARIHLSLAAGTSQKVDVYLGQVKALQQKAHAMRLDPAVTVLTVASVDFADGTLWEADESESPIDFPVKDKIRIK
jgi:nitrogen fixation protein FixH